MLILRWRVSSDWLTPGQLSPAAHKQGLETAIKSHLDRGPTRPQLGGRHPRSERSAPLPGALLRALRLSKEACRYNFRVSRSQGLGYTRTSLKR